MTIRLAPTPSAVPPQETEYQNQSASSPKAPPVMPRFVVNPGQIVSFDAVIDSAEVD